MFLSCVCSCGVVILECKSDEASLEYNPFSVFSGLGLGPASGLRLLDMIRNYVELSSFFFFFCGLTWTGFWLCGFFREAGFDSLASLASRPRLGGAPSHEACNVIFPRYMALGHCTPPLEPPQIQKKKASSQGVSNQWFRVRLISPSLDRK